MKFEPFRFNESWINYRRISGAFAVKHQGDRLYASRLKCLYRGTSYIIVTKERMMEGIYDDELLEFLFRLEPENFQGYTTIKNKFAKLVTTEEENEAQIRTAKILPLVGQM